MSVKLGVKLVASNAVKISVQNMQPNIEAHGSKEPCMKLVH